MIQTIFIYNLILIASTFFVYCSEKTKYDLDRRFLLFCGFIVVSFPAAIRYNIAYDYESYVEIYDTKALEISIELGWKWLINFLSFLDFPAQSLFVASSILTYGILFLSYPKKYGYLVNFTYIVLIYLQSYSFVRSSLALSFVLFIVFKLSSRYSLTVVLLLLAIVGTVVHKSAFLYIPVFIFGRLLTLDFLSRIKYLLIVSVVPCFLFRFEILDFFLSLPIVDWLGYRGYLSDPHFLQRVELGSGLGFLIKLYALILPLFFIENNKISTSASNYMYAILIAGIVSLILSVTIMIFDRVYLAFILCYPITIYMIFTNFNFKKALLLIFPFLLFVLFFFELSIVKQTSDKCDSLRASPYVSIFNKFDDKSLSTFYCE